MSVQDQRRSRWKINIPFLRRNQKIDPAYAVDEIAKGRTYASVADEVGVSRERVRQIAAVHGVSSPSARKVQAQRLAWFEEFLRRGYDLDYALKHSKCKLWGRVRTIASQYGALPHQVSIRNRSRELEALVERVRLGESYTAVSNGDKRLYRQLLTACRDAGVKSAHKSLNPKYANTGTVVPTSRDVDVVVTPRKRGRKHKVHGPVIVSYVVSQKGLKSAAAVGRDVGISRNAVIGIWFRNAQNDTAVA